jgi:hypothetical protein
VISLTFDRTSLSLPPLVVTSNPHGTTLHIPEDGLTWPAFGTRRTYAPDSPHEPGRVLLAAVADATELPVTIYAHADTTAALEVAQAELEAACAQWSYDLTLTVDGAAHVYRAEIVLGVPWGPIDSGMVRAHMARTSFSIPLNP